MTAKLRRLLSGETGSDRGTEILRAAVLAARIDHGLKIDDVVEAVFLDAFEAYPDRPQGVRFGDWLQGLIDPAIKELLAHPDRELENINLARSARAAEQGPGTV